MNLEELIKETFIIFGKKEVLEISEIITKICISKKCNNLRLIGRGESSLVFDCIDLVLKITLMEYDNHKSLKEYVSHSKYILQPLKEYIVDTKFNLKIKILEMPKLNTDNITSEDVISVAFKLRDDGYLWYDTKKENLGKDNTGKVYLFDYGELIYIKDMDNYHKNNELKSYSIKKESLDKAYVEYKNNNLEECIIVNDVRQN